MGIIGFGRSGRQTGRRSHLDVDSGQNPCTLMLEAELSRAEYEASRAPSLWANLVELAIQVSAQGGDRTRDPLVQDLRQRSFTRLAGNRNFTSARAHLFESARHALADIGDHIGSVLLTGQERLSAVRSALDQGIC